MGLNEEFKQSLKESIVELNYFINVGVFIMMGIIFLADAFLNFIPDRKIVMAVILFLVAYNQVVLYWRGGRDGGKKRG